MHLGFVPEGGQWLRGRWSKGLEHAVVQIPAIPILVGALLLEVLIWVFGMIYPYAKEVTLPYVIIPLFAAIAAYQNWRKSRQNSTVDDALKRKEIANSAIIDNPELLLPYVQSAFLGATNELALVLVTNLRESNCDLVYDTKIDMYIYSEIDNLEFVFDKSNHDLIDSLFVMRAIKIFIARNENQLFRLRARQLLVKGRYNHDFQLAAETLMLVAEWRIAYGF